MVKLRKLLSVRNGLCISGIAGLIAGAPLAICPALGVLVFFGKRESSDADKRAMNLTMRSAGIAIFSKGLCELLAKPLPCSLVAATVADTLFTVEALAYRFSGEWGRAKGRMLANSIYAPISCLLLASQVYALKWGEREDDD